MRVTVRLFARLREIAGAGELVLDVEAPATIGTVWVELARRPRSLRVVDFSRPQHGLRAYGHRSGRDGRNRVPATRVGWCELEKAQIVRPPTMIHRR